MTTRHTTTGDATESTDLVLFERNLPEPHEPESAVDEREYVRITPSETSLDPSTVAKHVRRLHSLAGSSDGWLGRLRQSTPVYEFCLVSMGGIDASIAYLVGASEAVDLGRLETALRAIFPRSYAFDRTTLVPEHLLTAHDERVDHPDVVHEVERTLDERERPEPHVAAVELHRETDRAADWQTRLKTVEDFADDEQMPLTGLVETMATARTPVVYQVLCRPKADWNADATHQIELLQRNEVGGIGAAVVNSVIDDVFGEPDHDAPTTPANEARIEEITAKDARTSFELNVRAAALSYHDPAAAADVVDEIASAFAACSHTSYRVRGTTYLDERDDGRSRLRTNAADVLDDIRNRTFRTSRRSARRHLPGGGRTHPVLVADPAEAPIFCLVDGNAVAAEGKRSLGTVPREQAPLARPPPAQLQRYQTPGLTLGLPTTQDDATVADRIAVPPSLQPLHLMWLGKTGSGKSTSLLTGALDNHAATDGASIVIEPKGDGMPIEYLRAHYARFGSLENVYYFDCAEVLPALSFFDIRDELAAGVPRTTAVEDVVDHYIELLVGIMGAERFEQAVRSPDIIRYLVKALFDPVHGTDAFTHRDLQRAAARLHETRDPPPVADDELAALLGGIAANSKRSFDELMQGVANRIEKIPLDDRLGTVFNNVHDDTGPRFDFADYLDEDAVVLFDTGGLRTESQRVLTLVLLSNLWTALRRRTHRVDDPPLVNLYLEEASSVATSGLLSDLLARSRSFGLSVTLAMQFPEQLRATNEEAYREVLNNVSTIVSGNVAVDAALTERFATAEMDATEVGTRLRALRRGQWLVSLPAPFDQREPRPFLVQSAPLPPGHPEGSTPLSTMQAAQFERRRQWVEQRTSVEHGLRMDAVTEPATTDPEQREQTDPESEPAPDPTPSTTVPTRIDSALPFTKRMPTPVRYDEAAHVLVCKACETRYEPHTSGMRRALACCGSPDSYERDDVPICDIALKLSPAEIGASAYSDRQLAFLQAVYTAHQRGYDPDLEYDLLRDTMLRLREYVGIDPDDIQALVDDGLLARDCDFPHRLYTVTPEGRSEIHVGHREGIAHGDGQGDLSESSLHVVMVEVGRRLLEQRFVDDPDSPAVEAVSYHGVDDGRLDAAALDERGEVVATLEAERSNNDALRAVTDDYDKMAATDPDAAIWIVKNRRSAHEVLRVLNSPPDGVIRVEKQYSEATPPTRFTIDQPGCTDILTVHSVMDDVLS